MKFSVPHPIANPTVHGTDHGANVVAASPDGTVMMTAFPQGALFAGPPWTQRERVRSCEWSRFVEWYDGAFVSVDRCAFRTDPTTGRHQRLGAGKSKGQVFAVGGGMVWLGQDGSPVGLSGLDLAADGKRLRVVKMPFKIRALAWSDADGLIVVGDAQIRILDAKRKLSRHADVPLSARPSNRCVVIGRSLWLGAGGLTQVDLDTLEIVGHWPAVGATCLDGCENLLATQSGKTVWLLDGETGAVWDVLELPPAHGEVARSRDLALTAKGLFVTYPSLRFVPIDA